MFVEAFRLVFKPAKTVGKSVTVQFGNPKGCSSFQLSPELLKALGPLMAARTAVPNEVVIQQGSPCQGVYVLKSGLTRLSIVTPEGREFFQRVLGPGCAVGLPATLCSQPYVFSAECQTDCSFGFIEAPVFLEFLRNQPLLCMEVVRLMGQELSETNERRTNFDKCKECGCSFADICAHELNQS